MSRVPVYVGAGSNLAPRENLRAAVAALRGSFGRLGLSAVYRNRAVGFEGADFLNLVVGFRTAWPVEAVVSELARVEASRGRCRKPDRFGPRPLDLDLLLYGGLVRRNGGLRIPREDILRYDFVLRPLAELAADRRHPELGLSYGELWARRSPAARPMHRVGLRL